MSDVDKRQVKILSWQDVSEQNVRTREDSSRPNVGSFTVSGFTSLREFDDRLKSDQSGRADRDPFAKSF